MSIGNYFKSGLSGAGTGAAIGSLIPGIGTLAGAGIGAGAGLLGNYFSEQGADEQTGRLDQATAQLQQLAAQQRMAQMQNIDRTIGYFKPAHNAFEYLYGEGTAPMPGPARNPFVLPGVEGAGTFRGGAK